MTIPALPLHMYLGSRFNVKREICQSNKAQFVDPYFSQRLQKSTLFNTFPTARSWPQLIKNSIFLAP